MSAPPSETNGLEEREMTRNQRGLVDTCFEEGQYESGIAMLDLLRSPAFKPPPDILRQLLYIALYPPPCSSGDHADEQEQIPFQGSPSKQKHFLTKTSFTPTLVASQSAQRVLFSFLSTNTPEALFRGLLKHAVTTADGCSLEPEVVKDCDEDSVIARESHSIRDCKHCWTIVKEGFIQRKHHVPVSQDVRKKRRRSITNVENVDPGNDSASQPAVVAEHAWPVLDWLLSLFEKDECFTEQKCDVKYSPLLLSQIPPPRGGFGPRQDVDEALDIVFFCMEQDDGLHRAIGARLFALLINLTHITEFDASMFTASVTARLHSSASQVISRLMTSLPKTTSVLTFQITLCQKYLSGPSVGPSSGVRRRKPQARARRGSGVELGTALSSKASSLPVSVTKLAVIPCDEILALVESQRDTSLPTFAMKYALLVAYALLQKQAIPAQKDLSWKNAQQDGRLEHIISSGFPDHGEGSELKKPLLVICGLWPPK